MLPPSRRRTAPAGQCHARYCDDPANVPSGRILPDGPAPPSLQIIAGFVQESPETARSYPQVRGGLGQRLMRLVGRCACVRQQRGQLLDPRLIGIKLPREPRMQCIVAGNRRQIFANAVLMPCHRIQLSLP